jgi:tetratricopeptide (TPR) repeat protein
MRHSDGKANRGSIDVEAQRVAQLHQRLRREGADIGIAELRRLWDGRLRPFWRLYPELYSTLAGLMVERSENFAAIEICTEGLSFFPASAELVLYLALSLARTGSPNRAFDLLDSASDWLGDVPDAWTLRARIYKDLWKLTGSSQALEQSLQEYEKAAEMRKDADAYYPEVNVATLATLSGDRAKAIEYATKVTTRLGGRAQRDYWEAGSFAEALLVLGRIEEARVHYAKAMELNPLPARRLTTRQQARLLLDHLGKDRDAFEDLFRVPPVVCATGHLVDASGRPSARFPAARESSVRRRVQALLASLGARFGYSSAAAGADLIFIEALRALGGEASLVLPVDRKTFCELSVAACGPEWIERYHAALGRASSVAESSFSHESLKGGTIWDFGNRMILGNALRRASELETKLDVLAVWDGKPGDGRGGTADMVDLARTCGLSVHVIHPLDEDTVKLAPSPGLTTGTESSRGNGTAECRIAAGIFLFFSCCSASTWDGLPIPAPPFPGEFHRVALDSQFRFYFISAAAALKAMACLRRQIASAGKEFGLALTAGPVTLREMHWIARNDVQGSMVVQGRNLAERALDPPLVLASGEFVALAATEGRRLEGFEYNGLISSQEQTYSVFRYVREDVRQNAVH